MTDEKETDSSRASPDSQEATWQQFLMDERVYGPKTSDAQEPLHDSSLNAKAQGSEKVRMTPESDDAVSRMSQLLGKDVFIQRSNRGSVRSHLVSVKLHRGSA